MGEKLTPEYDRIGDILHVNIRQPNPEQDSEELGDDVLARLNPQTGDVESLEYSSSQRACCARAP